ncbi:FecCD family ABC transporter permease [Halarcobacter anaerophilus]|uniref:ABC transporter permease n=1 Tax=Halarcobacter anaerophilus TaxID=877500 RepID=A0A4Q0Y1W8_9BACT|nr:iron ABC transporter permease [Halarcobacter anaerophilus]QDF29706.1 iron siderophore ABC transporter, permease protein [Halarcobacter anaerophilus]RXJ62629.1 ABC transporter permease [Halarcobacter anaerophilus]
MISQKSFWFFLSIFAFLIFALTLKLGYVEMSFKQSFNALFFNSQNSNLTYLIWELRIPRMLSAFCVGAVLALSGAILQSVLKNPLASPFTLGLSQGAAFGASFSIIILGSATFSIAGENISFIVIGAFVGALISSLFVLIFSTIKKINSQGLILAGVAIAAFFNAATMLLQYFSNDDQLAAAIFWTFGDLSKGKWTEIIFVSSFWLIGMFFVILRGWDFNTIVWGDNHAKSLGVKVFTLRIYALLFSSLLAAIATAFYGIIGFVGLIAPHIIKLLFENPKHHFLFFSSSILGGVFLMGADLLAKLVLSPITIPVGILTAFAGVPLFLFILIKRSLRD